jgi:hypothetical protein
MIRAAVAILASGALAAPASAGTIVFGRKGGNILPYTVTIAADGAVAARGAAQGVRPRLSPAAVTGLLRLARAEALAAGTTSCPGVLPDAASFWVRVGGRTTTVHGGCQPRFNELYAVLSAAVGL